MNQIYEQLSPLQRAFYALEKVQARLDAVEQAQREPIAIIGLGCRFPGGGDDPDSFWQLLRNGVDAVVDAPIDRWSANAYDAMHLDDMTRSRVRYGAYLPDVKQFDPQFFGISPREATFIDPQQRLLLEVSWEALERAGYIPDKLASSPTGVFIGISFNEYKDRLQRTGTVDNQLGISMITGNTLNAVAGRLSYTLGFTGPCLAVDTACSSSLSAVHLACQSLRNDECRTALAGGVNLILSAESSVRAAQAQMLSPDGRCKTFDATANGFVRGEGCGVVILKRLTDAQADGDHILALIRGSAMNQDGASSGFTTPNGQAQQALIRRALKNAGVEPHHVAYIEAHGTGTSLGDPIEVGAIAEVFDGRQTPLFIGSVKTNIGHTEAVAGIAGLTKVVMSLQNNLIPPHLHYHTPNPAIGWDTMPITVPTTLTPWPAEKRIAGVSSFGASGTNVHVVLEKAPVVEIKTNEFERSRHLLALSARTEQALLALARRYSDFLAKQPDAVLGNVCYTANVGRNHTEYRLAVVAESGEALRTRLADFAAGHEVGHISRGYVPGHQPAPKVAFLFTGQGSQYVDMGRELYETQPTFRQTLERCDEILRPYLNKPLLEILYHKESGQNTDSSLAETIDTQPALFALEYALATLWQSWGIFPDVVMGHSVGEYAAACIAGVFDLEEGLKLVVVRGRLMQARTQEGEVGPALAEFEQVAQTMSYSMPKIPLVSNVTGELAHDGVTKAEYWIRQGQESVRFADGMTTLFEQGVDLFLEIGPKATLLNLGRQCLTQQKSTDNPVKIEWLPSLRPECSDWQQMLESLGTLYSRGAAVNWAGFDDGHDRRKIILPTYPFQRECYWVDVPQTNHNQRAANQRLGPLIDKMIESPLHDATLFETEISLETLPFLADHRVDGAIVSPGACHLAMILSAAEVALGDSKLLVKDVTFPEALVVPEHGVRTAQVVLASDDSEFSAKVQLISFDSKNKAEKPTRHAMGQVVVHTEVQPHEASLLELRQRCTESVAVEAVYAAAASQQIVLGSGFRWLTELWRGLPPTSSSSRGEALGRLSLPKAVGNLAGYKLHPGLLDACFQVAGAARRTFDINETQLPFALKALHLYQPASGSEWWCHAHQVDERQWDIRLLTVSGHVVAEIYGFEMRSASVKARPLGVPWQRWLYELTWQQQALFGLASEYLTSPEKLQQKLAIELGNLLAQSDLSRYNTAMENLEVLSVDIILAALTKAGFTLQIGNRWQTKQVAQQLGVISKYHRLLHRLLGMLAEVGILKKDNDVWQVIRMPRMSNPEQQASALMDQYGTEVEAELGLLRRCGARLSEVLRGVQEPLELLFPNGDSSSIAQLYQNSIGPRVMNRLMQQALRTALEGLPNERGARILEVGAGTGSTTAYLLPNLPAEQTEYVYTDISSGFLTKAKERFAAYDFVSYQTFDLEQSPFDQNLSEERFDVVVAANVVHATRDLSETLSHIRQLLAPGGLLILMETTTRFRWVDLTFGLTDGWWRFADKREEHPLLTARQWQETLLDSGFDKISLVEQEQHGQAVIIAQAEQTISPRPESWLLLADESGIGETLAAELRRQGGQPFLVYASDKYSNVDETTFHIDPDSAADYRRLLHSLPTVQAVVHLWSLDEMPLHSPTDLEAVSRRSCGTVLHLVHSLLREDNKPPGLWLVTRGTQAVIEEDSVTGFAQASLWGMGRVIGLEHPELRCVCLDLDAVLPVNTAVTMLLAELTAQSSVSPIESQVALRSDGRYVARLGRHHKPKTLFVPNEPFRLEIAERGTPDKLQLRPIAKKPPAPGQVEIRVRATGLNFLDLLNVLGLLQFQPDNDLGGECAGEIVAVGEGVQDYQVGDRVIALLAGGCFSQYITVATAWVYPMPASLSFEEAATIPVNFLTAFYALHQVAQITSDDKVLIHAAASGTGMAAVQIAQLAGAEVYGTASSGKWNALRSLGVKHIYNSRTLDFAEALMADTEGAGVDIVLNALTGEGFIEKSLSALGSNGRFLEIAKRDIWSAEKVYAVRPDVSYHYVDMLSVAQQVPTTIRTILTHLLEKIKSNRLKPLPQTIFPISEVMQAFRTMQQAGHIGKIVVTQSDKAKLMIQDDATYLITGGLGGLGLLVAQWLVSQGAKNLILLGRNRPTPDAQSRIDALTQTGAHVTVVQADVTDIAQVDDVLSEIDETTPLRGIIHAVGVLDDGALLNQNWSRFVKVLAPKVWGAWNVHRLTQELKLDFFVLFSSAVGLFGNKGQANHAAANAFLDGLAHYRQAQGLTALSIGWGAWSETGAATRMGGRDEHRLKAWGQGNIAPSQGLEIFAFLLAQDTAQVAVTPINWPRFLNNPEVVSPFFAEFKPQSSLLSNHIVDRQTKFRKQLEQTAVASRASLLMQHLRTETAKVLGLRSPNQIDPRQSVFDLGLDSLMAVELRNQIATGLELTLPSTLLFDYPTLESLADYLWSNRLLYHKKPASVSETELSSKDQPLSPVSTEPAQPTSNLEALSDEEAESLLLDKLDSIGL
ncbi:MAG: SDR family NAD(P)-dependent oxidoreductase [Anaerolineae bacterium]|nr:SDR family NAD(P)-dependent oxidoreductase [Anaerolineae bacterium]